MTEYLIYLLTSVGVISIMLAAIGVIRMPDLYLRIAVTTKAATLGIGLILLSAALYFGQIGVTSRVVAIILFMMLTAPVGAHMIGRASYFTGIKLWSGTKYDDLKGKYHPKTHKLSSEDKIQKPETK